MSEVQDLRDTVVPKSDQLNADDMIAGPMTVRIAKVRRASGKDQPISLDIEGQRPFLPCKTMRRVLIAAWGNDGREWVGRSMTLYRDPEVQYGGVKVGGIRISHLSHIDGRLVLVLTVTRGKRQQYVVDPLKVDAAPAPAAPTTTAPAIDTKPLWAAMKEPSVVGRVKALLAEMFPGREAKSLKPPEVKALYDRTFEVQPAAATREPGQDDDEPSPLD